MNTAFHDAINFAWKINAVEHGLASRTILESYETERKDVAETLLDFDNRYAALFSKRKPSASEVGSVNQSDYPGEEKNEFIETFKASCEFTSGFGVAYKPNILNWSPEHPAKSPLFNPRDNTLKSGRIMHPANVTRVADANVVHLENEIPLNGSFRLFVFGGDPSKSQRALADLATNLERKGSFYEKFSYAANAKPDMYHEQNNPHSPFFSLALVLNARRPSIEISDYPRLFHDYNTHVYADDIWDARVPDAKAAAHAKMGFDQVKGGVVVCRPDGHVGCTVQLVEGSGTVDALNEYFQSFTVEGEGLRSGKLMAQL